MHFYEKQNFILVIYTENKPTTNYAHICVGK
jgi:hypothetical protein